jgi:hypothetical protein
MIAGSKALNLLKNGSKIVPTGAAVGTVVTV